MKYKMVENGIITSIGEGVGGIAISDEEYDLIQKKARPIPKAPDGYTYRLRADNLEWELVELPPVEPEPLTDEEALTRYANSLTGASDPDLISAAETLIKQRMED